jgi:hypothetical protein
MRDTYPMVPSNLELPNALIDGATSSFDAVAVDLEPDGEEVIVVCASGAHCAVYRLAAVGSRYQMRSTAMIDCVRRVTAVSLSIQNEKPILVVLTVGGELFFIQDLLHLKKSSRAGDICCLQSRFNDRSDLTTLTCCHGTSYLWILSGSAAASAVDSCVVHLSCTSNYYKNASPPQQFSIAYTRLRGLDIVDASITSVFGLPWRRLSKTFQTSLLERYQDKHDAQPDAAIFMGFEDGTVRISLVATVPDIMATPLRILGWMPTTSPVVLIAPNSNTIDNAEAVNSLLWVDISGSVVRMRDDFQLETMPCRNEDDSRITCVIPVDCDQREDVQYFLAVKQDYRCYLLYTQTPLIANNEPGSSSLVKFIFRKGIQTVRKVVASSSSHYVLATQNGCILGCKVSETACIALSCVDPEITPVQQGVLHMRVASFAGNFLDEFSMEELVHSRKQLEQREELLLASLSSEENAVSTRTLLGNILECSNRLQVRVDRSEDTATITFNATSPITESDRMVGLVHVYVGSERSVDNPLSTRKSCQMVHYAGAVHSTNRTTDNSSIFITDTAKAAPITVFSSFTVNTIKGRDRTMMNTSVYIAESNIRRI